MKGNAWRQNDEDDFFLMALKRHAEQAKRLVIQEPGDDARSLEQAYSAISKNEINSNGSGQRGKSGEGNLRVREEKNGGEGRAEERSIEQFIIFPLKFGIQLRSSELK